MNDPAPTATAHLRELESEYEIIRELGRGGTAVVYLARERELKRNVALKVVQANRIDDGEAVARLEREAQFVAMLRHPNIVPLLGTRHLSDGRLVLVMQHVPGRTLKNLLRHEGALPVPIVEHVLREMGFALDYAHRRHNIVHRDIKPENIYLDDECSRALLADFGIARSGESESNLTQVGTTLGTPAYMSPEQIDGHVLDGRSDLYSLGLVAYEMLTGQQPWAGHNLYTIIYKQKHADPPPITHFRDDVPDYLLRAVTSLLHKDRAARCADAAQFVAQLPRVSGSLPAFPQRARDPSRPEPVHENAPTIRYRRDEPPAPAEDAAPAAAPEAAPAPEPVSRPPVTAVPAEPVREIAAAAPPQFTAPELKEPVEARPDWERIGRTPGRSYSIKTAKAAAVLNVERPRAEAWGDTGIAANLEPDVAGDVDSETSVALLSDRGTRLLAVASVFLVLSATATIVGFISKSKDPDLHATALPAVGAPVTRWVISNSKAAGDSAARKPDGAVRGAAPASAGERTSAPASVDIAASSVTTMPSTESPATTEGAAGFSGEPDFGNTSSGSDPAMRSPDPAPIFTPYTQAPRLKNPYAVQREIEHEYPRRLREAGTGGTVVLWALIDEQGHVAMSRVKYGSGIDILDEAAVRVATAMRFVPAVNRDQKVKVWIELPVVFQTK